MADKGLYNLLIYLRANVASLQQDMDKAVGILQRSGGRMNQVLQGVFQGFGQELGRAVINSVKDLSQALGQLAEKGEAAGDISENFKKLGGSLDSIDAAKKAVLGTVNAFDLMRAANEAAVRGIPNVNKNFAQLAEFSNRFADATGGETLPVLNDLINALATGAPKALAKFGFELEAGASKAENQADALEQLKDRMSELAPVGESVAQGQERLNVSMEEARQKVGMAINENEQLAGVYNQLAKEIEEIDWKKVGDDVASMVASVVSVLPSLKTVTGEIGNIALGLRYLTGNLTPAEQSLEKIRQLQSDLAKVEESAQNPVAVWLGGGTHQRQADALRKQIEEAKRAAQNLKNADSFDDFMGSPTMPTPKPTGGLADGPGKLGGGGGGSAAKEIERLQQKWKELTNTVKTDGLKDAIDDSIKKLDTTGFADLKTKLTEQVANAFIEGNREFLKAGVTMEQLREQARIVAEAQVGEYQERMEDALHNEKKLRAEMTRDLVTDEAAQRRKLYEAYGLYDSPGQFGLSDTINGLAAAFGEGGQLTSALGQYSNQIDGLARLFYDQSTFLGNTLTGQQANAAGIQGPAMQNGAFGTGGSELNSAMAWIQAATAIYAQLSTVDERDRDAKDNRAWGETAGSSIGSILGAVFLMPQVGGAIGGAIGNAIGRLIPRGTQDPEAQQRHAFANWMEDRFAEMGGFSVYRRDEGRFQRVTNFMEGGRDRFNEPGWADALNKDPNGAVFTGLGRAFKELLGLTEDVGDQIAMMLFDNMEGNVNNLRMLVKRLGLSFEEVEEKLVEVGRTGEQTWLEIEVALQGASRAFQDGLVEIGAYGQAFQQALDSGGRGFEAIFNIRAIGTEAIEAQLQNFDQLKERLLQTFDPETVNAFFQALQQRGIGSFEELANAPDRIAGGIIADMDAAGAAFKETAATLEGTTAEVNGSIKDAIGALRENTAAVRGIKYEAPVAEDDLEVEAEFARGGVAFGPTRGLMGEAGPEAILPLTRKGGRLGVVAHNAGGGGNATVINVDARGAGPGVEHEIRRAMREVENRVIDRVGRSMSHRRGRVV